MSDLPRAGPRGITSLLVLLRFCQGQIGMTCVEHDRDVADEVCDVDESSGDVDDRSVAAIGDRPYGAADRGCAVAPLGAELRVVVGALEELERLLADGGGRRLLGALGRAGGVRGGALEAAFDERQGRQALVLARAELGHLE